VYGHLGGTWVRYEVGMMYWLVTVGEAVLGGSGGAGAVGSKTRGVRVCTAPGTRSAVDALV
jgi:hypothetical protein